MQDRVWYKPHLIIILVYLFIKIEKYSKKKDFFKAYRIYKIQYYNIIENNRGSDHGGIKSIS